MTCRESPPHEGRNPWLVFVIHERYTLLTFVLGALVILDIGWPPALLYLAYCIGSLFWFMRFICTHCGNARLGRCGSGMGAIALRLFRQRATRDFRRAFGRNVITLFPNWFVPLGVGLYRLVVDFALWRVILLVLFSLVAFVILPAQSNKKDCENCVMKLQCPWTRAKGGAKGKRSLDGQHRRQNPGA